MKIAAIVVISLLLIFIGAKVYSFIAQENQLSADLSDIQNRLTKAQTDEASLQDDAKYLANPVNLEKELRARFNYKKPGETMVVIIPPQTAATTTATSTH
jgi:hypothetical protein